jgi:crotonobetainyl-CoA:carnitine CoA-transferase CaiB-like acyl-CoA transferase
MTVVPLAGVTVVEFVHMVMGPSCGMILADLGADVIKVEPLPEGDNTRRLTGAGVGFFVTFNRNKQSLAIDAKDPRGKEILLDLLKSADVMTENFRPGAMDKLGFGWEALHELNPRLIYCSLKGFLPGPYEHRTALDEVVQMMAGLAYMTGPPGQPLRAGSSVNDIMGGMFAAIGILAALHQRNETGLGRHVQSALYENCVFLVAQHMAQIAVTGKEGPPMSVRQAAWGVYDIFTTKGGDQLFLGIVSDTQWRLFCEAFDRPDLLSNPDYASNTARVVARPVLIPLLQEIFNSWTKPDLIEKVEAIGLPFAPIAKPIDLFDDPHLNQSGGLVPTKMPDGRSQKLPGLPLALDGERLPNRLNVPEMGEHSRAVLAGLGRSQEQIDALLKAGVIKG